MQFVTNLSGESLTGRPKTIKEQVSLYREPPNVEITLDEFEDFALERLSLLRGIEQLKARGFEIKELMEKIGELERKHMRISADPEDLRRDRLSHFILRLAYCRTEDLRRWFLEHECLLLRFRLDKMKDADRADFMVSNTMDYAQVTKEEKSARREKLVGLCDVTDTSFLQAGTIYYKVPFTRALQLLKSRSVYVENGIAFVPLSKLVTIIVSTYRSSLSKGLVEASHVFDRTVAPDTRIAPLLKNMNKQYTGKDFGKSEGSIDKLTAGDVEKAAEHNMPLCMKNLHINLKKEHKLKHFGRLQYGLFLKGAGMELQDALVFWELNFSKGMTHEQFVKQYVYNIQHMYGKVGGRKAYTAYSCTKIIMGEQPGHGQFHGCPYRHMGDASLASLLSGLKLGPSDISSIVKDKQDGHYQLACQKHFDVTHPGHSTMNIGDGAYANHPNQFFNASIAYRKVMIGGSATAAAPGGGASSSSSVRAENFSQASQSEGGEKMEIA